MDGSNVAGATNATYAFTPTNGNTIKCNMVSNLGCPTPNPAVSNTITMTINPQSPVSIVITATSYAVMPNTPITFTAVPTNGGPNPFYQWKKNSVNIAGATNNTYTYSTPANNDNFSCVLTSNATSCVTNNPATSNVLNLIVYSSGTACASGATVVYGGMTYNTVQIGTQCWLRENLNIGKKIGADTTQLNNGIVEKYCYNNSESYCNTYGGLYQWAELVQYLNGASNTAHWSPVPSGNVKGLCPDGWHIPSNSELTTFFAFLGGTAGAGGKMKELGTFHWSTPNTSAGNTYGFTCLPGGYTYLAAFGQIQTYGNFWTISTGAGGTDVYWYGAAFNVSGRLSGQSYKVTGYSVRCLKD